MSLAGKTPWRRGLTLIESGLKDESVDMKLRAYEKYQQGLELCMEAIRGTPENGRKRERRALIDKYMSKAEFLKQELIESGKLPAPSGREHLGPCPPKPLKRGRSAPKLKIRSGRYIKKGSGKRKAPSSSTPTTTSSSAACDSTRSKMDAAMAESTVVKGALGVSFTDVIGLEDVKQILRESVIYPMLRPDLFSGVRGPPKGVLLFGPPGNGKTFIAKAIASECKSTFISVSASSLTSKYVGESEKQVASLFRMARSKAPTVLFIDEMDSLLQSRGADGEQESSRRIKTEFLIQMDGIHVDATSGSAERSGRSADHSSAESVADFVLVIGATNTPWAIDEAALRRFPKRVLVSLPLSDARISIIKSVLAKGGLKHSLTASDLRSVGAMTEGYSASDLSQVVKDAAMGPVRDIGSGILQVTELPPISTAHFTEALSHIKPCVDATGLSKFQSWNDRFGTKMVVKPSKGPVVRSKPAGKGAGFFGSMFG